MMSLLDDKNEKVEVEEPYVKIIKYLNHQTFKINNKWLWDIKNICENNDLDLTALQVSSIQLSQIKKLYSCFQNSTSKDSISSHNFLYYIFIILNLPSFLIKNILRAYLSKLYLEKEIKPNLNYFDIIERNSYLDDLISILYETRNQIPLFLQTINNFFT